MSYIKCPTCNRIIADKCLMYEEGLKKIENNKNLSDEEKQSEKMKLINSLKIPVDRYCCKMRLMTYRDLIKIVK